MLTNYTKAYDEIIRILLEQAQKISSANGAALEVPEGDYMTYRSVAGELSQFLGHEVPRKNTFSGRTLESGLAMACSHINTNPDAAIAKKTFKGLNIGSMLLIPITNPNQEIKAVLKLTSESDEHFSDKTINTFVFKLELIAKSIAAAMTDAKVYAENSQAVADVADARLVERLDNQLSLNQDTLKKSVIMLKTLAELSGNGVFIADADGSFVYANDKFQHLRDMTEEELVGDGWKTGMVDEDLDALRQRWEDSVNSNAVFTTHVKCKRKDGTILGLKIHSTPLKINREIFGHIGIANEIDS